MVARILLELLGMGLWREVFALTTVYSCRVGTCPPASSQDSAHPLAEVSRRCPQAVQQCRGPFSAVPCCQNVLSLEAGYQQKRAILQLRVSQGDVECF